MDFPVFPGPVQTLHDDLLLKINKTKFVIIISPVSGTTVFHLPVQLVIGAPISLVPRLFSFVVWILCVST